MQIGLLTPGFSADEADWAIPVLQHLVRHLAQSTDLRVLSLRYPHRKRTYRLYDAQVTALGGATTSGLGRLPLLLRALNELRAAHARQPFDVLHGFWADEAGFLAAAAGAILKIPAIVSVMGGELVAYPALDYGAQLSRFNRITTAVALKQADLVTYGAQFMQTLILPYRPSKPVLRLPLGAATDYFNSHPAPKNQVKFPGPGPHLLCAASLVPIKNHALLLNAMPAIVQANPRAHLHLVGDGPLRADLEDLCINMGLQECVTFHGTVPHPRMATYYLASDLLVVSSVFESQGMVVLEAGACGLPTIGTSVGILPDLAPSVRTVPGADSGGLAAAILELLRNASQRKMLGRTLKAQVDNEYSMQMTGKAVLHTYKNFHE